MQSVFFTLSGRLVLERQGFGGPYPEETIFIKPGAFTTQWQYGLKSIIEFFLFRNEYRNTRCGYFKASTFEQPGNRLLVRLAATNYNTNFTCAIQLLKGLDKLHTSFQDVRTFICDVDKLAGLFWLGRTYHTSELVKQYEFTLFIGVYPRIFMTHNKHAI